MSLSVPGYLQGKADMGAADSLQCQCERTVAVRGPHWALNAPRALREVVVDEYLLTETENYAQFQGLGPLPLVG